MRTQYRHVKLYFKILSHWENIAKNFQRDIFLPHPLCTGTEVRHNNDKTSACQLTLEMLGKSESRSGNFSRNLATYVMTDLSSGLSTSTSVHSAVHAAHSLPVVHGCSATLRNGHKQSFHLTGLLFHSNTRLGESLRENLLDN